MKRIWSITSTVFVILTSGANSIALFSPGRDSQTETSIPSIQQRYAAINRSVRKYRKVKKELSGFSLEGGELIAYFNGPRIVKITAAYFGETGRAMEEYYYWNEKLIFVFRRDFTYDEPMSGKVVGTEANRFYFSNDRLTRWIDQNGKARSLGGGDFQAKQQELLETSNRFLKAARSPEPIIKARNLRVYPPETAPVVATAMPPDVRRWLCPPLADFFICGLCPPRAGPIHWKRN
ncbi:MAG: hypothetical protein H0U18_02225 [Pyrinomonadaceae bacterium]|nr:hypothetical protein [Pyrinomonadaceae bacterium]